MIVCTPTETHYDVLLDLSEMKEKHNFLVIAEKPFCITLDQASSIVNIYNKLGIPLLINYTRRFVWGYQDARNTFLDGGLGSALNARMIYTRGMHDGCHAIDIFRYFFGEFIDGRSYKKYRILDLSKQDPTMPVYMEFDKCKSVIMQPCDGRLYGIFELDICFEKGRIRFTDNGIYAEHYPITDVNEWGHKSLSYDVVKTETGLTSAMLNVIQNAVDYLDGKAELLCTGYDAVKVHEILEVIK